MGKKWRFYDSHSGFAGAIVPLPKSMKDLADFLNGKEMSLKDAVEMIKPEADKLNGTVSLINEERFIRFEFGDSLKHSYRLIRYKEI